MTREIKFRAYKQTKDGAYGMFSWQEIKKEWVPDGSFVYDMLEGDEGWTVMQYTGLKDKNGKEIYYGDIVTWGERYLVGDKEEIIKVVEFSGQMIFPANLGRTEIIGNIYEHPNLLKQ